MTEIKINKPTKVFSKKIGFNYRKIFEAISKSAVMASDDKPASAVKELLSVISGIGVSSDDIEGITYLLIYKSIGATISSLFLGLEDNDFTSERNTLIINEERNTLLNKINETLENHELKIDNTFFDNPQTLGLLKPVISGFNDWLAMSNVKSAKRIVLLKRFKSTFVRELNKEWITNKKLYQNIIDNASSPFEKRLEVIDEWNAYYDKLVSEVNKPIFDEDFTLSDVYIPLRAESTKVIRNDDGELEKEYHPVYLEDYLNSWIREDSPSHYIKFLSGGPGSGKSSFAKMWATALTKEKYDIHILFISLQYFNIKDALTSSIDNYIDDLKNEIKLNFNPVKEISDERLVVIFDGLDELSQQGAYAEKLAGEFLHILEREESIQNKERPQIFFLVTGREITLQLNDEKIGDRYEILRLLPYYIPQDKRGRFQNYRMVSVDQRDEWWINYGKFKDRQYRNGMPPILKEKLPELTAQPFLNYLVAWNLNEGGLSLDDITSQNQIYSNIITQVLERKYANLDHPSTKGMRKDLFLKVLQEIAIVAWQSGDARIAKIDDIERRLANSDLREYFEVFQRNPEDDAAKLLTTFYFKQHSFIGGERKIEFTHKTFGEYLLSSYLIDRITLILRSFEQEFISKNEATDQILSKWLDLTHSNQLDSSIFNFLVGEVEISFDFNNDTYAELLLDALNKVILEGMDYFSDHKYSWKEIRNSEESFYLIVKHIFNKRAQILSIKSSKPYEFGNWLHKINLQDGNDKRLLNQNLNHLSLTQQKLFSHNLYKSKMYGSNFFYCNFSRVNFCLAKLHECTFENCVIIKANMSSCNIRGSQFYHSRMSDVDFRKSSLVGTTFYETGLQNCDFKNSKLEGVTFENCDLSYSDLRNCGVTKEQLINCESLYNALIDDHELLKEIKSEKPKLFVGRPAYNKW